MPSNDEMSDGVLSPTGARTAKSRRVLSGVTLAMTAFGSFGQLVVASYGGPFKAIRLNWARRIVEPLKAKKLHVKCDSPFS